MKYTTIAQINDGLIPQLIISYSSLSEKWSVIANLNRYWLKSIHQYNRQSQQYIWSIGDNYLSPTRWDFIQRNHHYSTIKVLSMKTVPISKLSQLTDSYQLEIDYQKPDLDTLLSTGEQISISLLCIALNSKGFFAISY